MSEVATHEFYMRRCFELAKNALGNNYPNPLVGSVVVHNDQIIGEGFNWVSGGRHAEKVALDNVSEENKHLLKEATLYVNLEPCSHYGKTPPCADRVINEGIKKVVVANTDPNPLVSGSGIERLREAGIEVTTGVLEGEGNWLNRRFFTYHQEKQPYIILKWAQSADGFFTKNNDQQHWITGPEAKKLVHQWRTEEQAVVIGTNTARVDNPQLTNRLWPVDRQPLRVVLDKRLELLSHLHLFDTETPTLVVTEQDDAVSSPNLEYLQLEFDNNLLQTLMSELWDRQIMSVIIEGGAKLLQSFIKADLWCEARIFIGQPYFGEGIGAPELPGQPIKENLIGKDRLLTFMNWG